MTLKEMKDFLARFNLSEEDANEIIAEMLKGIDVKIKPSEFSLEAGSVKVIDLNAVVRKETGRVLHTGDLALELDGVSNANITSFAISKIDYRTNEVFEVNATFFPFEIPQSLKKLDSSNYFRCQNKESA